MTERLDDAPPRTWQSILAEVPEATPVGGLTAAPTPAAASIDRYARRTKRSDETPADLLAAIEYEVADPATREALDTMRDWREQQRKEAARLDELEAPDRRPWLHKQFEGILHVLPFMALGFALILPRGTTSNDVDLPVAAAAGAALLAAIRTGFVQAGRTKEDVSSRGWLVIPAAAVVLTPVVTALRLLSDPSLEHGTITAVAIGVQIVAASAFLITVLRAPTPERAAELVAARPPAPRSSEDDFYDDVDARLAALEKMVEEQAPAHLRAALAERDPAVARGSRHTVVEAIRVLHEREQIDDDDAEWMLREALRATGPDRADR